MKSWLSWHIAAQLTERLPLLLRLSLQPALDLIRTVAGVSNGVLALGNKIGSHGSQLIFRGPLASWVGVSWLLAFAAALRHFLRLVRRGISELVLSVATDYDR